MIQMQTVVVVADNSGAKRLRCIGVVGGSKGKYAGLGDVITASVKEAAPDSAVKKGKVVKAVIVRTAKARRRRDDGAERGAAASGAEEGDAVAAVSSGSSGRAEAGPVSPLAWRSEATDCQPAEETDQETVGCGQGCPCAPELARRGQGTCKGPVEPAQDLPASSAATPVTIMAAMRKSPDALNAHSGASATRPR